MLETAKHASTSPIILLWYTVGVVLFLIAIAGFLRAKMSNVHNRDKK
jgi:hypothetical protein